MRSTAPPLDSLVKMLKAQNVLIVLDNCEHVIDTVAKMADVIGRNCPRVSIIVTSREPLGDDGERVYRVRSLSPPDEDVEGAEDLEGSDAVDLFVARARARDSTFELNDTVAPLVASVCRRLDGIPLAIELAASRLSSMSLDDLHGRLDQRFRLLTGGSRNALPRQQTLGATVAWSYDLLTEPERALLRRLSVFVGGFDLQGAEAVCAEGGLESFDVADLLSSLVNKSLVTAERVSTSLRYRLLETIRQYSADQLVQIGGESDTARTRQLHAEHYLQLCLEIAPELEAPKQGALLKRLDLEYDNLLATFNTLSADSERTVDVLALGVALFRFVMTRRNMILPRYLRDAVSKDTTLPVPVALRADALVALAHMTAMSSEERSHQLAHDLREKAFALTGQLDDDEFTVRALIVGAFTWADLDHRDLALEHAIAAVNLARSINRPRSIAEALAAVVYSHQSPSETHGQNVEALALFRQLNDSYWVTMMLLFQAITLDETKHNIREARAINEEAIELAQEIGSTFHLMMLLSNAGSFSFFLGEFDLAVQQTRRALRLSRRNGSSRMVTHWSIFTLAYCTTKLGQNLVGAHLTGAHDGIEERAIEPIGGYWSPLEMEARENNRALLREALGDDEYERAISIGKSLSPDRVYDLALGRTSHVE